MSPTFTDGDVGKTVESAAGEGLGIVVAVDEGTAYVDPEPGVRDSTASRTTRSRGSEAAVPLADDAVDGITDETVQLDDEFPTESLKSATEGDDEAESGPGDVAGSGESVAEHDAGEPVAADTTDLGEDVQGSGPGPGTAGVEEMEPGSDASDLEGPDGELSPEAEELAADRDEPGEEPEEPVEDGTLMDASEEIDGDGQRRSSETVPPAERRETDDSSTADDVDVDPEEVIEGEPEADVQPGEDVGQREEVGSTVSGSGGEDADRGGSSEEHEESTE